MAFAIITFNYDFVIITILKYMAFAIITFYLIKKYLKGNIIA